VEVYKARMMEKLRLHSIVEVVRFGSAALADTDGGG
jgi:hypothetical protein